MTFLIASKRHQGAMHTERHSVETENEAEQSGLNWPCFCQMWRSVDKVHRPFDFGSAS